jgi:hypothetical protein
LVIRPFKTHSQGGNETTMTPLTDATATVPCKHLSGLPPVVSDWQQSCHQPRCPHYCQGECCHPRRQSSSAPCPFDGKELPLDAAAAEDNPSPTVRGVPRKG